MRAGLYGRVRQMSYTPPQPPGQVQSLSAGTPTGTTVPLTWQAPPSGAAPFTYVVEYKTAAAATWTQYTSGLSDTSITVVPLGNSTTYQFRVKAVNAMGEGSYSAVVSATTQSPPSQVTALATGTPATTTVPLSWNAASGSAPITYRVEVKRASAADWTYWAQVSGTSYTVQGLSDGTAYQFRVRAENNAGVGAYSAIVSATTPSAVTTPGAPRNLEQAGFGYETQLYYDLAWVAPATGSAPTAYRVYMSVNGGGYGLQAEVGTTSARIRNVSSANTYRFYVTARNSAGEGPASNVLQLDPF